MSKELLHILQNNGFDKEEAQLYLIGQKVGGAPASDYAKRAKLNRTTVYNMLEHLVQRGLFTVIRKKRSKVYAPVAPEHISVESRKNADALERIVPELQALAGPAHRRPKVRFYEGWEGVKRVYQDTLTAKSEILNFANSGLIRQFWPEYDDVYVAKRVERNIHLRGIAPGDRAGRKVHGRDSEAMREVRLVKAKDFNFNNEINIYDHKIAIISFDADGDVFGIIIESPEVADTQRQIFEMAWRYAAKG